jgi:O-acetyl-ADP-ribose deacetylase
VSRRLQKLFHNLSRLSTDHDVWWTVSTLARYDTRASRFEVECQLAKFFPIMSKIVIVQGDITARQVDAIVNAANKTLLGGGGVDGAIHRAAGRNLLEECSTLGGCNTGEAKITKGYNLSANFVIHTVGPIYGRLGGGESELLAECYRNSLKVADARELKSIAFPSISTGAYGYPIEEASRIALQTTKDYLAEGGSKLGLIEFVTFLANDFRVYERTYQQIFSAAVD